MGVHTHWGGSDNGRTRGDRGKYRPPPQHGCAIHCNLYYHGILSVIRAEAGNAPIDARVGAARPVYTGDKGGVCSSRGGWGGRRKKKSEAEGNRD